MAERVFDTNLRIGGPSGPLIISGAGAPETVVTAPVGSIYLQTNGGTNTSVYRKESGVGATGWVAVTNAGGGAPAGASGEVQFNNGGSFAGAADVEIEGGQLRLPAISTPAAPSAGGCKLFSSALDGGLLPAYLAPDGVVTPIQPSLVQSRRVEWHAIGNSTTLSSINAAALTGTGTATTANVATTNIQTYQRRLEYLVTVAATTAVAGVRFTTAYWGVGGTAARLGGFRMSLLWGPATGVATTTSRAFAGMGSSTVAPTDVEPSSITNICGMGWDAADTNIQFMHRGAGAITKIDLGASFPVPTTDRDKLYQVNLYSPSGTAQSVSYSIRDVGTGAIATGTVAVGLPTAATLLAPRCWISVGGTSSVIGLAFVSLYVDSPLP